MIKTLHKGLKQILSDASPADALAVYEFLVANASPAEVMALHREVAMTRKRNYMRQYMRDSRELKLYEK